MAIKRTLVSNACIGIISSGILAAAVAGCSSRHVTPGSQQAVRTQPSSAAEQDTELVRRGKLLFDQTPKYAFHYVGNQLACADCHTQSGPADYAAPMIDVAGLFPMFSKRAGREITLKDRIDECFVRSETGRPLPGNSPEMLALVAYIHSLSRDGANGKPYAKRGLVKLPVLKGDAARGKSVYVQTQCAICHGSNGAGVPPVMPPLWGSGSFNDGAGMNNQEKMAAYVYQNMPQNHPRSLTAQQAYDVAAYIHTKPRPKLNPAYTSF
jgi:thiosulfate dehydrogenase